MLFINEALYGDKEWYVLLGGAMGGKAVDIAASMTPFIQWATQALRSPKESIQLTDKHLLDVFTAIFSSAGQIKRYLIALNTQEWLTRSGSLVESDVSAKDAFFRTVSGLDLQRNSEVHLQTDMIKARTELQQEGLKKAVKEWQAGLKAARDGNQQQSLALFQNAMSILTIHGYPDEKFGEFLAMANRGNETMVDSVDWSLYMTNLPDNQRQQMQERFTKIQQMKRERKSAQ